MFEYRISKYDPANRVGDRYMAEEWPAFSDIGKAFGKVELTYQKYLETETAYIDCCIDLLSNAQVTTLSIEQAEYYSKDIALPSKVSDDITLRKVVMACLREQCWFKLTSKNFFVHFGYDYYMYIGTMLPTEMVEAIAARYGLFCEESPSPYHINK